MNILIVAPEQIPVPPVLGGSVEICVWNIAKELAKEHSVTVMSRQHHRYSNVEEEGNLRIIRVPSRNARQYISSVKKVVQGQHFDLIQVENRPRFVRSMRQIYPQTPITLYLHSLTFVSPTRINHKELYNCFAEANLILVNSHSLQEKLTIRFPEFHYKMAKVPLGVDHTRFIPANENEKLEWRKNLGLSQAFVVLYAGRIIPRKGLSLLIQAMRIVRKKIPQATLMIVGGGKTGYVQKLKNSARRLRVPSRFIGNTPHNRIHSYFQAADCFVLPSQKHESFGLVNIEAMACEVPIIASNNGGIKEIIQHEKNGLLVDPYSSAAAFAKQIIHVASDPSFARTLAQQGGSEARSLYNWGNTAEQLIALYNEILFTMKWENPKTSIPHRLAKKAERSYVRSKWTKTQLLLNNPNIIPHMLDTQIMSESSLREMLNNYQMVYIKPDIGTYGKGVMRVYMVKGRTKTKYVYQYGLKIKSFLKFGNMYRSIRQLKRNRRYLVQKGVELSKYQQKRFDIRVMVQKNMENIWEATGFIARVAHPKKVVTNYHNGGTPASMETVFSSLLTETQRLAYEQRLGDIGIEIANQLEESYPSLRAIGVDIGMDSQLHPWIIEVNTRPDPYIFNQLKDKTMFQKVYSYATTGFGKDK